MFSKLKNIKERSFKKYASLGLVVFILCTVLFAIQIGKIKFDYDFEKFFPADDPEADYFFEHREKFNSDNDFVLIAIENKKGVFDINFLKKIDSFTKEIQKKAPYIKYTESITSINEQLIYSGFSPQSIPYINFDSINLKRDSTRIFNSKELLNTFIAKDAKSVCIFLKHEDYLSKKKSDTLVSTLENISKKYNFEKVRFAGRTIGQRYYLNMMHVELAVSIALSGLLVVLFLFIAFRSGWGVLIPQLVVFATLVWLLGMLGYFNIGINIILTTIPLIIFIVAMSDVIHLVSRYLDALRMGYSKFDSIKITIKEVGISTLLTSITTAIGFFSLYFVKVQPIQVFGLVIGTGVLLAYLLSIFCLPILFYLFPSPKYIYKKKNSDFWSKRLAKWFVFVIRNPKKISAISILIVVLSCVGISFIVTNNYLMDDLTDDVPIKQDFNFLDDHYGGIRPMEIVFELKDSTQSWSDVEVLNDLDTLENYLINNYGASIKLSLCQALKVLNRSHHGGKPEYFRLPQTKKEIRKLKRPLKMAHKGDFIYSIMDTNERILRINGSIADDGNIIVSQKNKDLEQFLDKSRLNKKYNIILTGTAHLYDKNIRYLSRSLVIGLCVSIGIVSLLMGLIFKSFRMVLISIVPNLIPLLIIGGMMGFLGIELKTSTAIIFTIAFGIAVDDTIHLLGKFKIELLKGRSKIYALKRAYITTGKAMILTSLILCSGFLLLLFSTFSGTVNLGGLLSSTLFIAVILDLTLLPVLLLLFYKEKK